MVNLELISIN